MKVGDYVRTTNGISKIVALYSNAIFNDKNKRIENNLIIKLAEGTPKGLLSLIEVGDYVDGLRVVDKDEDYIVIETFDERIYIYKNEPIKSIVTHEQFSQMEYKVGE